VDQGGLARTGNTSDANEFINRKVNGNVFKVPAPKPINDYVKAQSRFKHLLKDEAALGTLQAVANKNIEYYGLNKKAE